MADLAVVPEVTAADMVDGGKVMHNEELVEFHILNQKSRVKAKALTRLFLIFLLLVCVY